MQSLITYFAKIGFSENDLTEFLSCIKTRKFFTNEIILSNGQLENYLSFIDNGIVRYYVLANDKEITFDFAFKNSFLAFLACKNTSFVCSKVIKAG